MKYTKKQATGENTTDSKPSSANRNLLELQDFICSKNLIIKTGEKELSLTHIQKRVLL